MIQFQFQYYATHKEKFQLNFLSIHYSLHNTYMEAQDRSVCQPPLLMLAKLQIYSIKTRQNNNILTSYKMHKQTALSDKTRT